MITHQYYLVSTGSGTDLDEAVAEAPAAMVNILSAKFNMTRLDAGELISIVADVRICQIINLRVGARVVMPKAVIGDIYE